MEIEKNKERANSKVLKFGITGNPKKPRIDRVLGLLFDIIGKDQILLDSNLKDFVKDANFVEEQHLSHHADVIIALGGDGTLLRAARFANNTPLLGINLGGMGFLTQIGPEDIENAITMLREGNYTISNRFTLKIEKGHFKYNALNDITMRVKDPWRMIEISICVDNVLLSKFKADGIIVSTPTGSTAYNLSAGGPIAHPEEKLMILTPICAHKLTLRPIVLPHWMKVKIKGETKGEKVTISVDGQVNIDAESGEVFIVEGSKKAVKLIEFEDYTRFFRLISKKLSWG